jgi:rhamnosyltransferase
LSDGISKLLPAEKALLSPAPKFSVLLATFNGEAHLQEQLNSILNQHGVELQVYASDDNSADKTFDLLADAALNTPRLKVMPMRKSGSASGNFFRLIRDVDFSGSHYLAFSDQDDIWSDDKLSRAIEVMNVHQVDAYSSNVMAFWPDGRRKLITKSQPQREFDYMFESAGPGCTFVLSKVLAIELQDWLKIHQEESKRIALHDWFIYAFSRSRGYKWFIDHQSHMLYRQHETNVVGANVGIKAKFSRWQKLRKGWLRTQALLIADLLDYQDAWPIARMRSYRFFDRLILIMHINQLRRRFRDRIGFALFLLWPLKR